VVSKEVIPPVLVVGVLLALGAWLLRARSGRGPAVFVLVLLVFVVVTNLVFARYDAMEWQSFPGFALAVTTFVAAFVGIFAAVVVLRRRDRVSDTARTVVLASAVLFAVLLGINLAGTATYSDPARGATDVSIVARSNEWDRTALTAPAGRVTFYADNEDTVLHNFHVKDAGTIWMPSSHAASGVMELKAGSYEFLCDVHPDMKGTLTVT
jgi:plastocyanin